LHRELHERYPGVALFEHGNDEVSGCLYVSKDEEPSAQGSLLYFSVQGRLEEAEDLVEPMGGKVLKSKHRFGPFGWRVIALDSEGNRIALHAGTHQEDTTTK
jgi:hypothetical protein